MTAKEYLLQYRDSIRDTQNAIAHIHDLRAMAIALKVDAFSKLAEAI